MDVSTNHTVTPPGTSGGGGDGGEPDGLESQQVFLLILVLLLLVCFSVGQWATSRTKYLTEGSFGCLVGLLGGIILLIVNVFGDEDYSIDLAFPNEMFFDVLLPPIIFYQGYSMHKHRFFKNALVVMLLGLFGTIVSFACLSLTSALLRMFSTSTCLKLGAIMAATDSVAVLQVLNPERTPLLHSLVFGEGVINDASSIVLLRSVRSTYNNIDDGVDEALSRTIYSILTGFGLTFFFSGMIGVSVGLFSAFLMRVRSITNEYQERRRVDSSAAPSWVYQSQHSLSLFNHVSATHQVAFIGLLAYLAFVIAEILGLSGIMTLFVTGLVMSHYTHHNLDESAKVTTTNAFQALSLLSEVTIYIFVGMDSLHKGNWTNVSGAAVFALILMLLVAIVISRMVFVFPICFLQNMWNSKKLSISDMFIIVWAGTLRGAVSVALVIYTFAPEDPTFADRESSTVIAAVMALVVFDIIFKGMLTKPVINFFDARGGRSNRRTYSALEEELELPLQTDSPFSPAASEDGGGETPRERRGWLVKKWSKFDHEVMKPIFGGELHDDSSGEEQEDIPAVCLKKENSA